MFSNKDFLPSTLSNIFYMRHRAHIELRQSFSFSWWTVTSLHSKNVLQLSYWKSGVRGTSRHIVYFTCNPGRVVLGLLSPSPRVCTDGQTDGRTLTSEPKFFGSMGYQICLPMVLRELRYKKPHFSRLASKGSYVFGIYWEIGQLKLLNRFLHVSLEKNACRWSETYIF